MSEQRVKHGTNARIMKVAKPGSKRLRFIHHIDVVSNLPKTTGKRSEALVVSSERAEEMRFNITSRGWRCEVVFLD